MIHDFCIIGGGIVGAATAAALLARQPGASLVLIDKEAAPGLHQTGRNSGVIHSGIYYTPGSLKARLCRAGAQATKDFCDAHAIPYENRGKLIVATRPEEVPRLDALQARAAENGITVERLDAAAMKEREPNVSGLSALFVPAAAIVDYGAILARLLDTLRAAGAEVRLATAPSAIREHGDRVEVVCPGETIQARRLVACAGLQSDRVARMAGLRLRHRIVPFRGEYYRLAPSRNDVVGAMIYPVPQPGLPFLGVHLTPMIDGSVSLGPNAVLARAREGYGKASVDLRDMLDFAGFPGFWRLIGRNLRPGLDEMANSLSRRRYLAECQRYCPSLRLEDMRPMRAGIRAQAIDADGTMIDDFLFLQTDRMLHVCNAPSPAATSALPIGETVAARLLDGGQAQACT